MAPVDHLDIELIRHPHEPVDLYIEYPAVGPAVPPEEVRRRLGL